MITFCSLFSGSSGNSIYLSSGNTNILIDCGVSGKRIASSLSSIGVDASDIDAILVTHEHRDHIHAVGIMSRRYNIPIYANARTWAAMENAIGKIEPYNKMYFDTYRKFSVGDISIQTFRVPHDAAEPVGYNFEIEKVKITLATDIGHVNQSLISNLEGSHLIMLESNHDVEMLKCGPYPYPLKQRILGERGHLSNEAAGELVAHLAERGTEHFILGHLSRENNFPQLAYQTAYNALQSRNIFAGQDVCLDVAERDKVGKVVCL